MVSGWPNDSDSEVEAQSPEAVEGADTSAGPAGCRQTLVGSAVRSIADSTDQPAALRSGSTAVAVAAAAAAQHSRLLVIVVAMVKNLDVAEEALSPVLDWG